MNGKIDKSIEYSTYICQYWVGLMDGDGSIQVNHWRKKSLQYRLVIKLKNDPDKYNTALLQRIKQVIGGNVRYQSNNLFVIWVENHRKKISQILKIFDRYPPLTKRLALQYRFYIESLKRDSVDWYLENREHKYETNPDKYKSIFRFATVHESENRKFVSSPLVLQIPDSLISPSNTEKYKTSHTYKSKICVYDVTKGQDTVYDVTSHTYKSKICNQESVKSDVMRTISPICKPKVMLEESVKSDAESDTVKGSVKSDLMQTISPISKKGGVMTYQATNSFVTIILSRIPYFNGWLSGFIEAESCFTLRKNSKKNISFSISQKGEPFLLEKISLFFGGQNKVRKVVQKKHSLGLVNNQIMVAKHKDNSKTAVSSLFPVKKETSLQIPKTCIEVYETIAHSKQSHQSSTLGHEERGEEYKEHFYILEIYKKDVLKQILSHFVTYPLYGEKQKSLNLFKKTFI